MTGNEERELLRESLRRLIVWYESVRRPLPWRDSPTPYTVWISEIMLQQTRIEAVIPYYTRFLSELPDIPALAAVPEDRLLKLWEGLGYYSRARNLKKTAVIAVEQYGGELPASAAELRKLPGIGDYTAGAIASIAFGLPEPAVDGNVLRVMARLLASQEDVMLQTARRRFTELLRSRYPAGEAAGLLTEGIMELGETVCLPNGLPRCGSCPVRNLCAAHLAGEELSYPVKAAKKARRTEEKTVLLLHCSGKYAIRKRPDTGLLAGLWEFPNLEGKLTPEALQELYPGCDIRAAGSTKHIFTHVEWHMTGYSLECPEELPGFLWKTPQEIEEACSLPTAFRYYRKKL